MGSDWMDEGFNRLLLSSSSENFLFLCATVCVCVLALFVNELIKRFSFHSARVLMSSLSVVGCRCRL